MCKFSVGRDANRYPGGYGPKWSSILIKLLFAFYFMKCFWVWGLASFFSRISGKFRALRSIHLKHTSLLDHRLTGLLPWKVWVRGGRLGIRLSGMTSRRQKWGLCWPGRNLAHGDERGNSWGKVWRWGTQMELSKNPEETWFQKHIIKALPCLKVTDLCI